MVSDRDRASGQYAISRWDRVCTACGHTLGEHTAGVVDGARDCTVCSAVACRIFRPPKL